MTIKTSIQIALGQPGVLFAQEFGGQKLHVVSDYGNGRVDYRAACGRQPNKRGAWRMTCNVPLGHLCRNCRRIVR